MKCHLKFQFLRCTSHVLSVRWPRVAGVHTGWGRYTASPMSQKVLCPFLISFISPLTQPPNKGAWESLFPKTDAQLPRGPRLHPRCTAPTAGREAGGFRASGFPSSPASPIQYGHCRESGTDDGAYTSGTRRKRDVLPGPLTQSTKNRRHRPRPGRSDGGRDAGLPAWAWGWFMSGMKPGVSGGCSST